MRSSTAPTAVGLMAARGHCFAALVILRKAQEPLLGRLSPQELVELLKHPTCVAKARRIILDQLGSHYQRAFSDHWAFVSYAQDQMLDLDLNGPTQLS
jgi:hypothetical protein